MAFSLHPAKPEDARDITTIFQEAFKHDEIMSHFHPHTPKEIKDDRDLKFFHDSLVEGDKYGGRFTKVVDNSTGKTVAFSRWEYPCTLTPEQKAEKQARAVGREQEQPPEGANKELMDEFYRQLFDGRKKWIVPEETYFLHILAVHPSYQRLGLGSMLIRPGLEAADKAGAKTFIEASQPGLPLYLKHGWEPVDEMVIDMRPHGGHEIMRHKSLMREAKTGNKEGKVDVGRLMWESWRDEG